MLWSRPGAKRLGSTGPHAKSNCINARQPKLSVNKSLSTQTCFSLTSILCFRSRQSDWKVWNTGMLMRLVFQGEGHYQQLGSNDWKKYWLVFGPGVVWRLITVKQSAAAGNEWMNMHRHALGCRRSWGPRPEWAGTRRWRRAADRTACTPRRLTCYLKRKNIKRWKNSPVMITNSWH